MDGRTEELICCLFIVGFRIVKFGSQGTTEKRKHNNTHKRRAAVEKLVIDFFW